MYKLLYNVFLFVPLYFVIVFPTEIVSDNNTGYESSKQLVKLLEQTPYATYNSCGGHFEAKLDHTIVLEYKPDEEYDNDELCVWEIRNADCASALFTKIKSGFEVGFDYLQISGFSTTFNPPYTNIKMGAITGMEQTSYISYITYVIFTSDYSNKGTGFRMEIVGYNRRNPLWFDDFYSVSPIGSTSLRPYFNNMVQSFFIMPEHKSVPSLALDIEYVTETTYDHIGVFSFERNGQSIKFVRHHSRDLTGVGNASYRVDYYTNFIVLFYSDASNVPEDGGVVLNWYIPENATTKN